MTLTIKHKLILLGTVAILAAAILGITSYRNNSYINTQLSELSSVRTLNNLDYQMNNNRQQMIITLFEAVQQRDSGVKDAVYETIKNNATNLQDDIKKMVELKPDFIKPELLATRQEHINNLVSLVNDQIVPAIQHRASQHEMNELLDKEMQSRQGLKDAAQAVGKMIDDKLDNVYASVNDSIISANKTLAIVIFLTIAILIPLITFIILGITKPLAAISMIVEKLSKGSFDTEVTGIDKNDEIGLLARGINLIRNTIADFSGQVNAIGKAQAVIEFNLDGTIVTANANFLNTLGYTLEEIKGKHHNIFVETSYRNSPEYTQFWENLNRGQYQAAEYKRIGKGGKEVWIQASYNPILDLKGKPFKVVKYATDITTQKTIADEAVKLKFALDTVSAGVMMADADLNIMYANDAVIKLLGAYEKDIQKDLPSFDSKKVMGVNIDSFHKNPAHQRGMLDKLTSTFNTTIKLGGRIFDLVANPVWSANRDRLGTLVEWRDVTEIAAQKIRDADYAGQIEAIGKSQAVISFNMDGTIIEANQNFLSTLGYTLEEVKGKHHSMFVEPAYKASMEYQQFWENLNRGQYQAAEYKRIGKNGKEVWIQASYNPINGPDGKPFKVVKYATDTTAMVTTRMENEEGLIESVGVLNGVSKGDLTKIMVKEYKGTFSQIKAAVNATIEQLKNMVIQIKESAESVNSASSEISSGSADLSQRTEQQASSLEETAASMEQITGTVRANSENSNNANKLSGSARDIAEKGGKVVEDAVGAMSNIERSSQKISDIIGVIDEIAFQTNLLALNAAVEAARAGDAGKGFAVVASEVRTLAGRSASASKEIKQLIGESAVEVKSGASLVNQAGETLKEIVSSVRQVADIVSEIAAATVEQSTGINEINSAISQMDEATQQNAALVEENTAAAQSLVEQANSLTSMMQFFTISGDHAVSHQTAVPSGNARALPSPSRPQTKSAPKKSSAIARSDHKADGWEEF